MLELLENARINGNTPTFAPKARRSVCFSSHQPSRRRREGRLLTHDHPPCLVFQIYCVYVLYMYLLDVSIRDLKYFCVLFVLFVFLFMLLALLRCYTSIFDGFIWRSLQLPNHPVGLMGDPLVATAFEALQQRRCLLIAPGSLPSKRGSGRRSPGGDGGEEEKT